MDLQQLIEQASPDIRAVFQSYVLPGGENFVSEAEYAAARDRYVPELKRAYREYFAHHRLDAMVFPATRVAAPRIGEETTLDIGGRAVPFEDAVARNIAPGSTAGMPGLVLPAGLTAARPARGTRVRRAGEHGSSARVGRSGTRAGARANCRAACLRPAVRGGASAHRGMSLDYQRLPHRHPR